jgi:hypothetical protein
MDFVKFKLCESETNKTVILKRHAVTQIYENKEGKVTVIIEDKFHYKLDDKLEEVEKKLGIKTI